MSTTIAKVRLECCGGGIPTHFITYSSGPYGRYCDCHYGSGSSYQVVCDGTEARSYCLLGCEKCCTMIKEKNKREDEHLKKVERKLEEAEKKLKECEQKLDLAHKDLQDKDDVVKSVGDFSL